MAKPKAFGVEVISFRKVAALAKFVKLTSCLKLLEVFSNFKNDLTILGSCLVRSRCWRFVQRRNLKKCDDSAGGAAVVFTANVVSADLGTGANIQCEGLTWSLMQREWPHLVIPWNVVALFYVFYLDYRMWLLLLQNMKGMGQVRMKNFALFFCFWNFYKKKGQVKVIFSEKTIS